MVRVYFESDTASELVATFTYEEDYIRLVPTLTLMASEAGYKRVTESIEEAGL